MIEVIIEKIKEIVKRECSEEDWKFHILIVVKYAKLLAKKLGVDEKLAELGALLHDIGRIRIGGKDHEITGAKEAEKILKELNCPEEIIEEIKHCVEAHGGKIKPRTKIAEIIANADAMAHFDAIPTLFLAAFKREKV